MGKEVELDEEVEGKETCGSCDATLDEATLMDVTDVAAEAGFVCPVKISRSLFDRCLGIRSKDGDDTVMERLWMFLFSLHRHSHGEPLNTPWPRTFVINEGWYIGHIKVVRRGVTEDERSIVLLLPED